MLSIVATIIATNTITKLITFIAPATGKLPKNTVLINALIPNAATGRHITGIFPSFLFI